MANVRNGNTFFVDTDSSAGTATSFIAEKNIRIAHVIASASAGSDEVKIYDKHPTTNAVGQLKLHLKFDAVKFYHLDISSHHIVCPNGIWVDITGSVVVSIVTQSGSK